MRSPVSQSISTPSVSIVVVSYGSSDFLPECLASLFENVAQFPAAKVALVENHPDEAPRRATEKAIAPYLVKGLRYLPAPSNLGYGGAANYGWQQLGRAMINIVLNPDMRFPVGWLAAFLVPFERDRSIGIVGCKLLHRDGTIQHAGGVLRYGLALAEHFGYGEPDDGRWNESCAVDFVTGAALGLRGALLGKLGGFNPAYFPGYYEDVDLSWRARLAGWKIWYEAGAVAYHFEGGTFGRDLNYYRFLHRNRLRFVLQNFSTAMVLEQFVPAERLRLQGTLAEPDRQASALVYRAAARSFLEHLSSSQEKPGLKSNPTPKTNSRPKSLFWRYNPALENVEQQELALTERLVQTTQEVKAGWLVEEKPFRSALPFVAAFRQRFNSISTRWYVKPILAQQVEYNAAVSRAIEDLSTLALGSGASANLQNAALAARLLALETRLERIESLLEKLTDTTSPIIQNDSKNEPTQNNPEALG